jgi:antitoxin (DNA-binding transcriptional repressor) of toxin-antitoxin stability system
MKKMTVQEPQRRVKKGKPVTISKRGRPLARLALAPTLAQWPDFKSRLTKTRGTRRSFRDIVDDLRQERV